VGVERWKCVCVLKIELSMYVGLITLSLNEHGWFHV
jgi:hypothetical protein